MKNKQTLILGSGLAGLSAAYHLRGAKNHRAQVFEKTDVVGGTARSYYIDGFTFDITGHLLHLHHPYTKKLIHKLLGDNIYTCVRKTAIYSKGVYTDYPFQVNTYGLPKSVVAECVNGFKEAVKLYPADDQRQTSFAFQTWSQRTFGKGIHRHFMKPYNEKLWQVSLKEMTAQWCGMFVPQPKLDDVIGGSKKNFSKSFGYNATFIYPQKGGIQVLAESLARGLDVQLKNPFEQVNWKSKQLLCADGKWKNYDHLVSTVPLMELLKRMPKLPRAVDQAMKKLRWTSVLCLNLGVNRANISDKSWIYFPEKKFVFYRVGFPMNFTPHGAPKGCSSMYVEIGYPPGKTPDFKNPALLKRVIRDLNRCGILQAPDQVLVSQFIPIPYAYVIYTPDRTETLSTIFNFLKENHIYSIGRYGEWKYSFMEEAILDGKKTAETILNLF